MRRLRWLVLPLLAGVLLYATSNLWLRWMGEYLILDEPPVRCEAVVVLSGGWSGSRILKAAELVKEGYAPVVLVSGAGGKYGLYENELAIPFAVRHGYPAQWFIGFPQDARSTREEAGPILAELGKRNIRSFLLVTSNYHTRRSGRIFREKAKGFAFRVVAAPDEVYHPDSWWREREGRKTAFYEWVKLVTDLFGI